MAVGDAVRMEHLHSGDRCVDQDDPFLHPPSLYYSVQGSFSSSSVKKSRAELVIFAVCLMPSTDCVISAILKDHFKSHCVTWI